MNYATAPPGTSTSTTADSSAYNTASSEMNAHECDVNISTGTLLACPTDHRRSIS